MRCETMKKWMSDEIDGELTNKRQEILARHLESCVECRSYKSRLERLHKQTQVTGLPVVPESLSLEFSSRLKARLLAIKNEKKHRLFIPLQRKWVYALSGFLVLILAVGLFWIYHSKPQREEMYILSYESAMSQIEQEIWGDEKLADLFNAWVLASIEESLDDSDWKGESYMSDIPLLWENLTDEEWEYLKTEIKTNTIF